MTVIAEFDVRNPHTALSNATRAVPDVELDLIQQVGTEPERPYLFVWARAEDLAEWEAAMAADETVGGVRRYAELDGEALYRMQITDAAEAVSYPMWVDLGAEQLHARWSGGAWHVRMRFPDREALAACEVWCEEHDVAFDLRRIYADPARGRQVSVLTREQRTALRTARDMGYFEIPRDATMSDIADQLGVSSQAVSERLRRGYRVLVDEYVE